jgi:hypothetical protein
MGARRSHLAETEKMIGALRAVAESKSMHLSSLGSGAVRASANLPRSCCVTALLEARISVG